MITVDGEDRLKRKLTETVRLIKAPAPRDALAVMLRAARQRVPVVTGYLGSTGQLADGSVKFDAPYAAPIHWGWRARHIKPNQFLVKGIESSADQWLGVYADEIETAFEAS